MRFLGQAMAEGLIRGAKAREGYLYSNGILLGE
jgi:hypothetical protein